MLADVTGNDQSKPSVTGSSHSKAIISSRFSAKGAPAPVNFLASQLPYIEVVKTKLQQGGFTLETYPCPCGQTSGVVISEVDRYGLPLFFVLCFDCGTIRIDPYLDKSSLEDFYTFSYQDMYARSTDVEAYFLRQRGYGEKVLDVARQFLKEGSWVYEVGCGAGGALEVFQTHGYQVAGCDYSAELIAAGRQRVIPNIYQGSVRDIQTGAKADLIYLHHVFEHINDPLTFLQECREVLAPGGNIIIIVPDVSRIDRLRWPAGDLSQFLHIAHKYNFSYEGLHRLGRQAGFRLSLLRPNPGIQTPCSHMPELWIALTLEKDSSRAKLMMDQSPKGDGAAMLQYLRRTEKLYSWGLCRGQLIGRLKAIESFVRTNLLRLRHATPAKVIRKLKGASLS